MKKIKEFLTATLLLILASCTGGNESIIGGPTVTDYFPSIIMIAGVAGLVFAGTKYVKGNTLGDISDEGASLKKTAGIIAIVSGLIFISGVALYFAG